MTLRPNLRAQGALYADYVRTLQELYAAEQNLMDALAGWQATVLGPTRALLAQHQTLAGMQTRRLATLLHRLNAPLDTQVSAEVQELLLQAYAARQAPVSENVRSLMLHGVLRRLALHQELLYASAARQAALVDDAAARGTLHAALTDTQHILQGAPRSGLQA